MRARGLLLLLAACASDPLTPAPTSPDAAAVVEDAGSNPPDAASSGLDAAIPDLDASAADASAADAQLSDAGAPSDAQLADASPTGPRTIAERCFADIAAQNGGGPAYDRFGPTIGSHCFGTNHQAITGVERVVFLGDSVTVGTPPTQSSEYYRSVLAERLAARFGLEAPGYRWRAANPFDGRAYERDSGAFSTCAKWGARTDDLLGPGKQLEECFPPESLGARTLVIMTMGGNDIAHLTKEGGASRGRSYAELQQETEAFVAYLRDTMRWLKDPARFPNGSFVVFANPPEFTDGTGRVESCGLSTVAGFDDPWPNPADLETLVVWALEEYMSIAVETGTDLVWMLESFCGHGFVATGRDADPSNRCYRGPNTERWFDLTCIHPNPTGHAVLADMFMAVVEE